jgi:hypothetical protein
MSADGPLFHKYNLSRTDGKPMGDAFVLELKDPYAADALVAYADACEATHPELAEDMRERYGIRRAAKDETMRTMRDQIRDTCTRAEKAESERDRLRDALNSALEWAGPMGEAPESARPAWFDKARAALSTLQSGAEGKDGLAMFRNTKYLLDNGEELHFHVNTTIGANTWKNGEWKAFVEGSPEDCAAALKACNGVLIDTALQPGQGEGS